MVNLILPENILAGLMEIIEEKLGLYFPREKWDDLERALQLSFSELGHTDIESFSKHIIKDNISSDELEILAANLTVGETYFFREPNSLNAFEYNILPDIVKAGNLCGRSLRIWSAGCATGEEPYTIAMILKNSIPSIDDWDITILATDINMKFIHKARAGVYTKWSFRDVPRWITDKYFVQRNENLYELKGEIKNMVTFSYLNLMDENYPSVLNDTNAMDVIFCRNVLMYFSENNIKRVAGKFNNSLREGGYCIVSQTELSEYYFNEYQRVNSSGSIIYKKDSFKKPASATAPLLWKNVLNRRNTGSVVNPAETSLMEIKLPEIHFFKVSSDAENNGNAEFKEINEIEKINRTHKINKTEETEGIDQIRELYETGSYDDALKRLIPFVSLKTAGSEAFAMLARIYADKGILDEAEKCCREAIVIDNMNPGYHYLLATIYREKGVLTEAVSSLRKAIYLNPDFIIAYYTLGIIAVRQNKKPEAEKYLDTALSLLKKYGPDEFIPESEGIPAGRLAGIIESVKARLYNEP